MQDYLPIIKTTLLDWLQLTFANPLYAASLAIAVYLLTAIVYGIKIATLKRKHRASESARTELLSDLTSAQQRLTELKERLTQRSQQIAGTIRTLAANFDLGEQPLSASEDLNADGLWQQHERAVALLVARLRGEQQTKTELLQSYQTQTAKLAEKEAVVDSLQSALADKTGLVAKLERALQEQKFLLIEEQEKAQQTLTHIIEKHLTEATRLAELEQQALEWSNNKAQLPQGEEILPVKPTPMPPLQVEIPAEQIEMPIQAEARQSDQLQQGTITLQDWDDNAESSFLSEPERIPPVKESASGVAGKMKNLFGKSKPVPHPTEAKIAESSPITADIQPQPALEEDLSASFAQIQLGKIRNLFNMAR